MQLIRRTLLVLSLAPLAACATVPENETADPTANYVEVSDGIFRGARPDRAALERFQALGFRTLVNLENEAGPVDDERAWADELGLRQIVAPMSGVASPDNELIARVLSLLADEATRPVFVHCARGRDRTGVVIGLHRVFNEGWSADDARAEMMERGFTSELVALRKYFEDKAGL
jgi:protein tyrosine/serine phosphatase